MGRIRTWRCGEVGLEGTRYVLDGGRIGIGGKLASGKITITYYQNDRLIPMVGEIVKFHDFDDMKNRISVHRCTFVVRRNGRERIQVGDWICYAHQLPR